MKMTDLYFKTARAEESNCDYSQALLHYLASFCHACNSAGADIPVGTIEKIRRLQMKTGLSDAALLEYVHSYGPLSDEDCRHALTAAFAGDIQTLYKILGRGGNK